jgi:UDP-N-acetylmuramyl pentapeptide synthase
MQMLHNAPEAARWLRTNVTGELRTDSRLVKVGDGFIAWPGAATDGRRYLAAALAQGAAVCLMEAQDHAAWLQGLRAEAAPKLAVMSGLKAKQSDKS